LFAIFSQLKYRYTCGLRYEEYSIQAGKTSTGQKESRGILQPGSPYGMVEECPCSLFANMLKNQTGEAIQSRARARAMPIHSPDAPVDPAGFEPAFFDC
jgi:hypothetical protein